MLDDLGILVAHQLDAAVDQARQDGSLVPNETRVTNGPAHYSSQNVAAFLVRWTYAVRDHEGDRAAVIGKNPKAEVDELILPVAVSRDRRRFLDHPEEDVGLQHGALVLQDHRYAFQSCTCVDVLGREVSHRFDVGIAVVLHEHEIPELHVPLVVVDGSALGSSAETFTAVDMDLGARAARPRNSHVPEIVLPSEPQNAPWSNANLIHPDLFRLVVGLEDGDPELVRIHPPALGNQFP